MILHTTSMWVQTAVTRGPPTIPFHRTWFWACSSLHLYSAFDTSASTSFSHLLTQVWIFCSVNFVVRHVYDPYISTALTLELKSLVGLGIYMDIFHILLGTMKAGLAFQILPLTSLSVPPFVSIMLPWYVKDCNSSSDITGLSFLLLMLILS